MTITQGVGHDYRELRTSLAQIFQPDGNFRQLRATMAEIVPPCIPYIGLYLTDLTFIEGTMQCTVGRSPDRSLIPFTHGFCLMFLTANHNMALCKIIDWARCRWEPRHARQRPHKFFEAEAGSTDYPIARQVQGSQVPVRTGMGTSKALKDFVLGATPFGEERRGREVRETRDEMRRARDEVPQLMSDVGGRRSVLQLLIEARPTRCF